MKMVSITFLEFVKNCTISELFNIRVMIYGIHKMGFEYEEYEEFGLSQSIITYFKEFDNEENALYIKNYLKAPMK